MRIRKSFINHADRSASLTDKHPNWKRRNSFGMREVGKTTIPMKLYKDGEFVREEPHETTAKP